MAALGAAFALRGLPESNVGPVALGAGILYLGFGAGTLVAWGAGLAAGMLTVGLYMWQAVSLDLALAGLAVQLVCTLFPLPFVESGEQQEADFERRRAPLAAERESLRATLEEVRGWAQSAERRGRETDALYHAGREISKLLTLGDTLEFSREVLRDTLHLAEDEGSLAFVLALVDEDAAEYKVGIAEGMDKAHARLFEQGFNEKGLFAWLRARGGQVMVAKAAAEPELKGVVLPPGVRGFMALPLLIQEQAIGWVVVFDMGEAKLEARDFSNLRILCSQIAIGIEKATLYDKLQRLSITDGLTGLFVHRHFQSRLEEELKRAERYKESLSLVILDIDHFKDFNNTWGHLAGDAVLKAVASVMLDGSGPSEMAVRYGGEEFVLVVPRASKESAMARAEVLHLAVNDLVVPFAGEVLRVTASLGVATYPDDAMTKNGLIDAADQALYQSKKNGRDRVTGAPALPSA
jgi:diguanylate cyclase (GGDEF)-like protein